MNEKVLNIAIHAAIMAGEEILKIYEDSSQDFSIEKKSDDSPLTIADKRSHDVILNALEQTKLPVLSEEGAEIPFSERQNWARFWLVDPLDGTKEFIRRNGEFTVNIALVENGQALGGIIYVPVTGTLYFGWPKHGARKIRNITSANLEGLIDRGVSLPFEGHKSKYTVVASRSHMNPETKEYIDRIRHQYEDVEVISAGSALKICLVAEGKADIYPRFGPTMEWDTAAGHAIAKYAGKNILLTDERTELRYNKENLMNPWFVVR